MMDSLKDNEKFEYVLLSINHALVLWEISPTVRSISFTLDENSIDVYFIYDKFISDDAEEISECIATQILADTFDVKKFMTHHIQCDFPNPIPQFGLEGYRREECVDKNEPSILSYPDPEALLKEYAGTGKVYVSYDPGEIGFKEVLDCEEIIGEWFDKSSKQYIPTKRITINYDKEGKAFIVPSNPKPFLEFRKIGRITKYFSKKYLNKSASVLLSIKTGLNLWGVAPNLRMVTIGYDEKSIDIYFIYYDFMSDEAMELSECAATEVQADFSFEFIRTHHIQCDFPQPVPQKGQVCAYCRKEPWVEK